MSQIDLQLDDGAELVLSLARFSSLSVTFVPSLSQQRGVITLSGATFDENTLSTWTVGNCVYMAQPETEVSRGRDGFTQNDDMRERFHYLRLHPGGTNCALSLPDTIRSLTLITDQGYRGDPKPERGPSRIAITAEDGADTSQIQTFIRASGVSLRAGRGIAIQGAVVNPKEVDVPDMSGIRLMDAPPRAWIIPESLMVWKVQKKAKD